MSTGSDPARRSRLVWASGGEPLQHPRHLHRMPMTVACWRRNAALGGRCGAALQARYADCLERFDAGASVAAPASARARRASRAAWRAAGVKRLLWASRSFDINPLPSGCVVTITSYSDAANGTGSQVASQVRSGARSCAAACAAQPARAGGHHPRQKSLTRFSCGLGAHGRARAATGHAAAPSPAMNSRRLISALQRRIKWKNYN
jgi:hypothetical protein